MHVFCIECVAVARLGDWFLCYTAELDNVLDLDKEKGRIGGKSLRALFFIFMWG